MLLAVALGFEGSWCLVEEEESALAERTAAAGRSWRPLRDGRRGVTPRAISLRAPSVTCSGDYHAAQDTMNPPRIDASRTDGGDTDTTEHACRGIASRPADARWRRHPASDGEFRLGRLAQAGHREAEQNAC